MSSNSRLRWILFILCAQLLLAGFVSVTPGSGVQRRLDAREVSDSQAFQISLQQAMKRMTRNQIEAYEWAVHGLDAKTFVERYGTTPSVREVIVGQVARFVGKRRKEAALLEAQLKTTPDLVEQGWRSYQEALDLYRTYQPEVTRVVLEDIDGSAERQRAQVFYRVLNPKGLRLKSLQCRVWWQDASLFGLGPRVKDFDCLAQKRAASSEYYVMIPATLNFQLESVRMEPAKCGPYVRRECWGVVALAKDVAPELVELWRIREEMRIALSYQFSL